MLLIMSFFLLNLAVKNFTSYHAILYNTSWKKDFDDFEKLLSDFKPNNFCIVGDLNARIGVKQTLDKNLINDLPYIKKDRNSLDAKVNAKCKKLFELIEDIGGIVLNGRTVNDNIGHFTFIGGRGNSVIDYCICSNSFLHLVDELFIGSKPYSTPLLKNENKYSKIY